MSNNLMVVNAMKDFAAGFNSFPLPEDGVSSSTLKNYYEVDYATEYKNRNLGESPNTDALLRQLNSREIYLQNQYIAFNANPLGSKDALNAAADGTEYSAFHEKYHATFRDYLNRFELYDIFLVDANTGNIVYSVYKELDYATSLKTGAFKDSGIGQAFAKANLVAEGEVAFDDYKPYLPSYNDQAVFIGTPIYDGNRKLGVLIYQAPIERINAIMTSDYKWSEKGFGESGETYLVGKDGLLRNESRFLIEDKEGYLGALENTNMDGNILNRIKSRNTSIGLQSVSTPATQQALEGNPGYETFPDYRNVPVLSAYTPVSVFDTNWALMSEIDVEEAFRPAAALTNNILLIGLIATLVLIALAVLFALRFVKSLSTPINELDSTVREINEGNLDPRVEVTTQDELGDLGTAINTLMDEKVASLAQSEEDNERLNNSIINLIRALDKISDKDFSVTVPVSEDIIGTVAASLNTLTGETSDILKQVTGVSGSVLKVANEVKSTSDNVINLSENERHKIREMVADLEVNAQSMLSMAEEAKQANSLAEKTIENTQQALERVNNSNTGINSIRETIFETEKRIKRLGERSQEISGIVGLIDNIAERTHILALNASMHAASAGEAGRGFAVVADEVQRLAENAKESTEEISALVNNIRTETFDAVNAMNTVITQVSEGTKLAEEAGSAMVETEKVTNSLVGLVRQITEGASKQAGASASIRERANEIREQTIETEKSLSAQKSSTDKLTEYSVALNESIGIFKLAK